MDEIRMPGQSGGSRNVLRILKEKL